MTMKQTTTKHTTSGGGSPPAIIAGASPSLSLSSSSSSSSFRVASGALCFGMEHNVRYGSSQPIQIPRVLPFDSGGGTVLYHSGIEFNFAALNGLWDVYPLVVVPPRRPRRPKRRPKRGRRGIQKKKKYTMMKYMMTKEIPQIVAWFVCHRDLSSDPFREAERILLVANSPYEKDNGTNRNTEQTFDGRVFVINRYDWDHYDTRDTLRPRQRQDPPNKKVKTDRHDADEDREDNRDEDDDDDDDDGMDEEMATKDRDDDDDDKMDEDNQDDEDDEDDDDEDYDPDEEDEEGQEEEYVNYALLVDYQQARLPKRQWHPREAAGLPSHSAVDSSVSGAAAASAASVVDDHDDDDDDDHDENNNKKKKTKKNKKKDRMTPEGVENGGVRMELDGEYSFGRFGLTHDRKAVHSFLFFTADTPLHQTRFFVPTDNEDDENEDNDNEDNDNEDNDDDEDHHDKDHQQDDNDQEEEEEEETEEEILGPAIYTPLTPEQRHAQRLQNPELHYSGFNFLRSSKQRPTNLLGPFFRASTSSTTTTTTTSAATVTTTTEKMKTMKMTTPETTTTTTTTTTEKMTKTMEEIATSPPSSSPPPTLSWLFSMSQIRPLQEKACPLATVEPQLEMEIVNLLNELCGSWIVRLARIAHHDCHTQDEFVERAFPDRNRHAHSIDRLLLQCMNPGQKQQKQMQQQQQQSSSSSSSSSSTAAAVAASSEEAGGMGTDAAVTLVTKTEEEEKMALQELVSRYGRNEADGAVAAAAAMDASSSTPRGDDPPHKIWTFLTPEQIVAGIHFLLGEVLELSGNCARDHERNVLVPYDIRIAVANDRELHEKLGKAKYFYPPDMWFEKPPKNDDNDD